MGAEGYSVQTIALNPCHPGPSRCLARMLPRPKIRLEYPSTVRRMKAGFPAHDRAETLEGMIEVSSVSEIELQFDEGGLFLTVGLLGLSDDNHLLVSEVLEAAAGAINEHVVGLASVLSSA